MLFFNFTIFNTKLNSQNIDIYYLVFNKYTNVNATMIFIFYDFSTIHALKIHIVPYWIIIITISTISKNSLKLYVKLINVVFSYFVCILIYLNKSVTLYFNKLWDYESNIYILYNT